MTDERSSLTVDDVREEADKLLHALDATRHQTPMFQDNWRELWQLLRESNSAGLTVDGLRGPWRIDSDPGQGDAVPPSLAANSFAVPIWPLTELRNGAQLSRLLNWAGVRPPANGKPHPDR